MRALALLLVLALVAGCVQAPDVGEPPIEGLDAETGLPLWVVRGVPSGETHDHADPAQHVGLSTSNFQVVGHDPLVTQRYGTTAGHGCGGTGLAADGRKLAVAAGSAEVAFTVADVTDPAAPKMLGELVMPNIHIWDVTPTPDGKHVLVGGYPVGLFGKPFTPPRLALAATWRDACGNEVEIAGPEQYLPYGPGIVLVSIADPSKPAIVDWVPQPIGPHSVGAHLIDGKVIATASVTNLEHDASYYTFFEVVGNKLVPLSVIRAPGTRLKVDNGHVDVYVAKHPADGKTYAWLANWNDGMRIYDMTDLRNPKPVGHWRDAEVGSLHTTYPLPVMWGERHYTIVGQEVGEPKDLPSGWVYVIDDTDPAKPFEVGRWTLPIKPMWKSLNKGGGGLAFSPHYVTVVNTTLFATNYHGGMWAIDIADPAQPDAVGLFYPPNVSPKPWNGKAGSDGVGDVIVDAETGLLTTWGFGSGVYVLRFDEASPMPKPPRWPFEYPAPSGP